MSEYIKTEVLEDICRLYGISYDCIIDEVNIISAKDIVSNMSVSDIRSVLDKKESVFATQVWTKDDIIAGLKAMNVERPDETLILEIADEAKQPLEDCSENWECLHNVIKRVLNRRNIK